MDLRVAGIVTESVVDGPGFRYVVFAQGCNHGCEGCHNPDTHSMCGGYIKDTDGIVGEILANKYIDGVTFSGGEPFLQVDAFIDMAEKLKAAGKHIVCYTGYTFETLLTSGNEKYIQLLSMIDMLIDGPYVEAMKDLSLPYRGSRNQRIINVKKSIVHREAVAVDKYRIAS